MRGSSVDFLIMVGLITTLFLGSMIGLYFSKEITNRFKTSLIEAGAPESMMDDVFDGIDKGYTTYDNMFMIVIFGALMGSLVLSFLTKNHPLFIVFSFIFLAFGIIFTVIGKEMYERTILAIPDLATQITKASWFWNNATIIISVFGCINIFLMYYGITREGG